MQARFWEAVAGRCAKSPAVFCYDLMNEPVVPGRQAQGRRLARAARSAASTSSSSSPSTRRTGRGPTSPASGSSTSSPPIRKHDQRHLITVGLVDWSLDRTGLTSGFVPEKVADDLDFVGVHLYPETGKVDEALKTLKGFAVGKPVVIEETFPLKCSLEEFERFIDESRKHAAGWIGFYWGKPPEECRKSKTIQDAIMLRWLEFFQKRAGEAERSEKIHQ